MQTYESFPSGNSPVEKLDTQIDLEKRRQVNLAEYESNLINEYDEHPWWSFFDGGLIDEEGACWAVYNRWCNENDAHGWKVVRCPTDQVEYREISVRHVKRQEVFCVRPEKDGLRTFQLLIYDQDAGFTNEDVLNLLIYHNDSEAKPSLRLWKHKTSMKPVSSTEAIPQLEVLSAD